MGVNRENSTADVADYAVRSDFTGQFAWFAIYSDAEAFIKALPSPEIYSIVELTRGAPSGSL